jgi:cobalt-zinc-cadmium resistance protein CzcA
MTAPNWSIAPSDGREEPARRRDCSSSSVLFLLLGNIRAALITAAVIPFAMLMTLTGMVQGRVSANLMSLGALDFGLIVDGAVIIVENCLRRLGEAQHRAGRCSTGTNGSAWSPRRAPKSSAPACSASSSSPWSICRSFALTGIEGKTFHPWRSPSCWR